MSTTSYEFELTHPASPARLTLTVAVHDFPPAAITASWTGAGAGLTVPGGTAIVMVGEIRCHAGSGMGAGSSGSIRFRIPSDLGLEEFAIGRTGRMVDPLPFVTGIPDRDWNWRLVRKY